MSKKFVVPEFFVAVSNDISENPIVLDLLHDHSEDHETELNFDHHNN